MRHPLKDLGIYRKVVSMHSAHMTVQGKLVVSTVGTEGAVVGAHSSVCGQVVLQTLTTVASRDELATH